MRANNCSCKTRGSVTCYESVAGAHRLSNNVGPRGCLVKIILKNVELVSRSTCVLYALAAELHKKVLVPLMGRKLMT